MSYNPNDFFPPAISRSAGPDASNASGSSIGKGVPVRLTASGMALVDPSVESQVDGIAGITRTSVATGTSGDIVSAGLLEDISTSIAVGFPAYLGSDGLLTGSKPSIGTAGFDVGDFIVRLGIVSENTSNPSLKDLLVNIQIVGML